MSDHDLYFGDFERDGEDVVRRNLDLGLYQNKKAKLARLFLDQKAEARRATADADQTGIARSTKDASWVAAKAAVQSAERAKWANVISGAALLASLAALFISYLALTRS
jgi:hypothetical protein